MKKLKCTLLLCMYALLVHAQIKHVEPLNWWVGMQDPHLQIMVNGDGIADAVPVINYPGVQIKNFFKGDSKNYLFINLIISPQAKPGKFLISFFNKGAIKDKVYYELMQRVVLPSSLVGFNSKDIICLITPDRFANGDPSNDVVPGMHESKVNRALPGTRHGGDIRGIIQRLDYLKSMGYTAIWPQPMLENNMSEYSYHGYSITNHYKVDPRFGSLDEYKELAYKARSKGIKLIFDVVLNHIGSSHWWMSDLPFKDWINYPTTKTLTTHVRTVNQDLNASKFDHDLMTKGWFVPTMPDLNGDNPFLANYLIQNNIWWIETLQLGGIRQDTYGYSSKSLLNAWAGRIMKEYPQFSLVGEEWSLNPLITSYWQRGKMNTDGYKSFLGSTMDFPLQWSLVESLKQKDRTLWGKGLNILYESLANDFIYADPNKLLVFGDNHDMDRVYTQLNNDVQLTKMAMTFLLTIRGIPQLYYGTEVLLDNSSHPGDHGFIRCDMPGGWNGDSLNVFDKIRMSKDQVSMQDYMQKLMRWRASSSAITEGKTLHFAPFNDIYVYFRYTEKEKVMIVLNRNETDVTIDPIRFKEIIGSNEKGRNVFSKEILDFAKAFVVPAKSTSIFEIINTVGK